MASEQLVQEVHRRILIAAFEIALHGLKVDPILNSRLQQSRKRAYRLRLCFVISTIQFPILPHAASTNPTDPHVIDHNCPSWYRESELALVAEISTASHP